MTNNLRVRLIAIIVVLQMAFFTGWYLYEDEFFSNPIAKIMVKAVLYDPRDFLSGQYIHLSYAFSEPSSSIWSRNINDEKDNSNVWIILENNSGIYEPIDSAKNKPSHVDKNHIIILGKMRGRYNYRRISYNNISRYFVPEGTKEPKNSDKITVELNVYASGKVKISKVFVEGKIWP